VPDYFNKRYIVELLIDGQLKTQICTEGAKGGFKASWAQLVKKHGDLEVQILAQDHAKKVLGAREYGRQERQQGSKPACPPAKKKNVKKKAPAKKSKAASPKKAAPKTKAKKKIQPKKGTSKKRKPAVDLEAARKSQAKLDAFLEKVLS
jgi:hypothetical protein